MKKKLFILALSLCVLAALIIVAIPASASDQVPAVEAAVKENVMSARFLNMLNRNFVYNSAFDDADAVTDNSILALLDLRDAEDPDYISEQIVKGFVYDMYGIEIAEISENTGVHREGYLYIAPRGFTSYKHEITDITENEDGSYFVTSNVTVCPHDDNSFVSEAKTLFVPNSKSAFGYNIISSDIKGVSDGI